MWKKFQLRGEGMSNVPDLKIPMTLLHYHEQEEQNPGHYGGELEEVIVDMSAGAGFTTQVTFAPPPTPSPEKASPESAMEKVEQQDQKASSPSKRARTLHDIFSARLESLQTRQEEENDLVRYEQYVRDQYLGETTAPEYALRKSKPPLASRIGSILLSPVVAVREEKPPSREKRTSKDDEAST